MRSTRAMLDPALLLNRALSQGSCLQTLVGDLGAGVDRPAVLSCGDARLGSPDRLQLLAQVSDQGELRLLAVEFGSCLRGFSGLLLMQLHLGRNLRDRP